MNHQPLATSHQPLPAVHAWIGDFAWNVASGFDASRRPSEPAAVPLQPSRAAERHESRSLIDPQAGTASASAAGHPGDGLFKQAAAGGESPSHSLLNIDQQIEDETDHAVEQVAQQIMLALAK